MNKDRQRKKRKRKDRNRARQIKEGPGKTSFVMPETDATVPTIDVVIGEGVDEITNDCLCANCGGYNDDEEHTMCSACRWGAADTAGLER